MPSKITKVDHGVIYEKVYGSYTANEIEGALRECLAILENSREKEGYQERMGKPVSIDEKVFDLIADISEVKDLQDGVSAMSSPTVKEFLDHPNLGRIVLIYPTDNKFITFTLRLVHKLGLNLHLARSMKAAETWVWEQKEERRKKAQRKSKVKKNKNDFLSL